MANEVKQAINIPFSNQSPSQDCGKSPVYFGSFLVSHYAVTAIIRPSHGSLENVRIKTFCLDDGQPETLRSYIENIRALMLKELPDNAILNVDITDNTIETPLSAIPLKRNDLPVRGAITVGDSIAFHVRNTQATSGERNSESMTFPGHKPLRFGSPFFKAAIKHTAKAVKSSSFVSDYLKITSCSALFGFAGYGVYSLTSRAISRAVSA